VSLKPLPYREVQRRLEAAGFTHASQKGSHIKFVKQSTAGVRAVIVPPHREVASGAQRSILRQAGLTEGEWEQL
jgi:predicted RNA binding protein YcfA (HicA-like mRNA interferase family)